MTIVTTENRDAPEFAASLMERLCPFPRDRLLVLRQLLNSTDVAKQVSTDVWALTLFQDGFRLNVGPVEVMTFKVISQNWPFPGPTAPAARKPDLFEIRLLLHGDLSGDLRQFIEEDEDTHGILPSSYKSVPAPQFFYVGLGELNDGALSTDSYQKIEMALTSLASLHAAFIRHAAHTPSGAIRKTSNFRRSHSQGLYVYAESFVREDWQASSERSNWSIQEELPSDEPLVEGASITVKVNAFERNPVARLKCIAHYGTSCAVCGFSFGVAYGSTAAGYVHVHHLKPLASIGKEYVIDPIKDLRPVCANCHAVIHLRQPPYSIEELKGMLSGSADA